MNKPNTKNSKNEQKNQQQATKEMVECSMVVSE